jgi:hypothetical protein
MRAFINLFLSIVLPISALFIVVAIGYFSMTYDLGKAMKLGTLAGVLSGTGFSIVMAGLLLFMRKVRTTHSPKTEAEYDIVQESTNGPVDQKFILLMDRELAFEVVIHSIIDQDIGDVSQGDKRKGTIRISTPEQIIDIAVSSLTKHSSQVEVKADTYNTSIEQIIHYLKNKEHSFLQY